MSSNSDAQQQAIDWLEESATAQPFLLSRIETNEGVYQSTGQTGNSRGMQDSYEYQIRLLAMALLNLENHFDSPANEVAEDALGAVEAIKRGQLDETPEFNLQMPEDFG